MRDDRIEHLIRLVEKSQITELEIQVGFGRKIRISIGMAGPTALPGQVPFAAAARTPTTAPSGEFSSAAAAANVAEDSNILKVVAPMVGTFYRSSSPENPPFVEVGTRIDSGHTLCIIEAMKIMNEIASEVQGNVRKILVENGQPVEFGQVLFLVEKPS
jgi:acetyl-CoA carboxylase biotin carboxyl carrier protein